MQGRAARAVRALLVVCAAVRLERKDQAEPVDADEDHREAEAQLLQRRGARGALVDVGEN
jgi:hypothetical protein